MTDGNSIKFNTLERIPDKFVLYVFSEAATLDSHLQALDYVGLFSTQVCARIFITVLCNTTGTNGQPDLKEVHGAKLSGFWLDNTKFMTCAHFLETIRDTNSDETEKLLKAQNLTEPRAFVCARKRVGALDSRKALSDPQTWPVHLLGLSRSSDIAIFELAKGSEPSPHSVPLDMLSPSFAMPTDGDTAGMSFDETDLAHSNLFAAYYPGHNISVEDSDVSISRKQLARQANIPDTWGLWCAESQHSLSDTDPHPAVSQCAFLAQQPLTHSQDFVTTFTPNCRSVAFGSVETGYRGHPKLHKNGSSCFVQTRDCSIVGVYGCSGGIVCHLYREKNRWKTAVVGVCKLCPASRFCQCEELT
jgi:hypothetical protein